MGLLVDAAFVDSASTAPALQEMLRPALIEALFTRNDIRVTVAGISRVPLFTPYPIRAIG